MGLGGFAEDIEPSAAGEHYEGEPTTSSMRRDASERPDLGQARAEFAEGAQLSLH